MLLSKGFLGYAWKLVDGRLIKTRAPRPGDPFDSGWSNMPVRGATRKVSPPINPIEINAIISKSKRVKTNKGPKLTDMEEMLERIEAKEGIVSTFGEGSLRPLTTGFGFKGSSRAGLGAGERSPEVAAFATKFSDMWESVWSNKGGLNTDIVSGDYLEPMKDEEGYLIPGSSAGRPEYGYWKAEEGAKDTGGGPGYKLVRGDIQDLNFWQEKMSKAGIRDERFLTNESILNNSLWQGKFMRGRAERFYGMIDPSSFGETFLNQQLGIGRRGGKYYDLLTKGMDPEMELQHPELEELIAESEDVEGISEEQIMAEESEASATVDEFLSDDLLDMESAAESLIPDSLKESGGGWTIQKGSFVSERRSPKLSNVEVSKKQLTERLATWEYFQASKRNDRLFGFSPYFKELEGSVLDKPSVGGTTIIANDATLMEHYKEILGQSKWLKPIGGAKDLSLDESSRLVSREIPIEEANRIMLSSVEDALSRKSHPEILKSTNQLINALEASGSVASGPVITATEEEEIADLYHSMTDGDSVEETFFGSPASDTHSKLINQLRKESDDLRKALKVKNKKARGKAVAAATKRLQDTFLNKAKRMLTNQVGTTSENINARGFSAIQREIQDAPIGSVYSDVSGGRYEVSYIDDLSQLKLRKAGGGIATAKEVNDAYRKSSLEGMAAKGMRPRIDLHAVREIRPGVKDPIVNLYFGTGEQAGIMQGHFAGKLRENIRSGYLGTVSADIEVGEVKAAWPSVVRKKYITGRLFEKAYDKYGKQKSGEALGIVEMTDQTKTGKQITSKTLFHGKKHVVQESWELASSGGKAGMLYSSGSIERAFMNKAAPKLFEEGIAKETSAASAIGRKGFNPSRGLWVGLTIAAGAMLLWRANRIKGDQVLSPGEVPESMYGSSERGMQPSSGQQPMTRPVARITPTNGGYSTNIEVQATDNNGIIDYAPMARSIGNIASSHLGSGSARTSLHVMDESSKSNRHKVQRDMNQLLRA